MGNRFVCFTACTVLAFSGLLTGCETQADKDKLAAAQRNFDQTVSSVNRDLDEKLIDAEMKNQQLKHGEKAACRWLKKEHPAADQGHSWKEACTAIYHIQY